MDGVTPITSSLPAGNLLFIGPLRSTEYFTVTGTLATPVPRPPAQTTRSCTTWTWRGQHPGRGPHPVTRHGPSRSSSPAIPPTPLMKFHLLFAGQVDGRRVAVLAFDIRHSDLPLQVAFPILISNLVEWLAPGRSGVPGSLQPGAPLTLLLPPSAAAEQITITRPDGATDHPEIQRRPVDLYPHRPAWSIPDELGR